MIYIGNTCFLEPNEHPSKGATGHFVYSWGTQVWLRNGSHHRDDGPALVEFNGYKEWWVEGVITKNERP